MKYFLLFSQKIIIAIICVLIAVFVFVLTFNAIFTKENIIKNINGNYISMQKIKLNNDLQSVCYANGVTYEPFKDFITDDIILKNNYEYINSVFDYINNKAAVIVNPTSTAVQYEIALKIKLNEYAKSFKKEEYSINENSINGFASLAKMNFSNSVVPILGFEPFINYIKKYNILFKTIPIYLFFGLMECFLFLFLFNKGKKYLSFVNILHSISSAGLILSIINGLALFTVITKNTALNSSYLKILAVGFFRNSLISGLILLFVSQILLVLLLKKKKGYKL